MGTEETGSAGDKTTTGGEKTFSQADVDRIVRERLGRERDRFADYDELKAKAGEADKNKTQLDKVMEKLSGLEERAVKAERAALRADVAQAKGLTAAQAKRLQGDTREALEADADELLSMFKPADKSGGDGEGKSGGENGDGKAAAKPAGDGKDGDGRQPKSLLDRRPKEKLTPGAVPATGDDVDPAKLADSILSGF